MEGTGLTLICWNVRGVAEPVKMLLEFLHLSYKEIKLELGTPDPWPRLKDTLGVDFPSLPYFYDGDSKLSLSGSIAICRFLAQKYSPKMVGSAMNEYAEVDTLLSITHDLRYNLDKVLRGTLAETRATIMQSVNQQLERANRYMRAKVWLSGKQVSIADFEFCELLEYITSIDRSLLEAYPHLKKLQRKFNAIPEIAKYKETQPPFEPQKYLQVPPLSGC